MAPSIAFLFLIVNRFQHERIWRQWLDQIPDSRVYFHCKAPEEVTSPWVRERLIASPGGDIITYRPDWGSVELVRAMVALLRTALRDPARHTHFCFLSESCIPAVGPAEAAARVRGAERSWIDAKFRPNNGYSALHQFSPMRCGWRVCKADQWCLLLRKHAELVVRRPAIWKHFKMLKASDEIFIPTLLCLAGALTDSGRLRRHRPEATCRRVLAAHLRAAGERIRLEPVDPETTDLHVGSRTSRDQPSTDDIMNTAIMGMRTDWPIYGDIEARKVTYVDWSYSCLHPTTFVWNLALHTRARERGCLFVRKVIEVDEKAYLNWMRQPDQYIPSTPLVFRDNDKDRRNRKKIQHYTDITTPYNERLWPETDCWDYVKQRSR